MDVVIALTPPIGVSILFYLIIRSMIRADRIEREAVKQLENQEDDPHIDRRQDSPSTEGSSKTG